MLVLVEHGGDDEEVITAAGSTKLSAIVTATGTCPGSVAATLCSIIDCCVHMLDAELGTPT